MNNVCVIFLNFQCSNNHASVDPEYDSVDNASTPFDNNVKSIRSVGHSAPSEPQETEPSDFRSRMVTNINFSLSYHETSFGLAIDFM